MHQQCREQGALVPVPRRAFLPSTRCSDAGPIVERNCIDMIKDFGRWMGPHEKHEDLSRGQRSRRSLLPGALPHVGIWR